MRRKSRVRRSETAGVDSRRLNPSSPFFFAGPSTDGMSAMTAPRKNKSVIFNKKSVNYKP